MNKIGQLRQQLQRVRLGRRPAGRLAPVARLVGVALLLLALLGTVAAHTTRARKASKNRAVYLVTATAYEAVTGQTDSKPFLTADNSRIPRGYGSHTRWLALSRDLLRPWGGPFAFGDKVRVEGISPALDGVYTVHDTMHPRFRHRLDVLAHPREHLSLSQPGVQLRRVAAASPESNRRSRPTYQRKVKAPRRPAKPSRKAARQTIIRPRSARTARHPASVARQQPKAAKKPLARRQKHSAKRVTAQLKGRRAARKSGGKRRT